MSRLSGYRVEFFLFTLLLVEQVCLRIFTFYGKFLNEYTKMTGDIYCNQTKGNHYVNYRTKPDILSYRWDRKVDNQQVNCKFFVAGILVFAYYEKFENGYHRINHIFKLRDTYATGSAGGAPQY